MNLASMMRLDEARTLRLHQKRKGLINPNKSFAKFHHSQIPNCLAVRFGLLIACGAELDRLAFFGPFFKKKYFTAF